MKNTSSMNSSGRPISSSALPTAGTTAAAPRKHSGQSSAAATSDATTAKTSTMLKRPLDLTQKQSRSGDPSADGPKVPPSASPTSASAAALAAAALPPALDHKVMDMVNRCDWRDRTIWIARQLFGGQSVNGFLRATATVQRIKRQRARQTNATKAKQEQRRQQLQQQQQQQGDGPLLEAIVKDPKQAPTNNESNQKLASKPIGVVAEAGNKRDHSQISSSASAALPSQTPPSSGAAQQPQQEDEEELKGRVMNARTAKKLKSEMEIGLRYCEALHAAIRGTLQELLNVISTQDATTTTTSSSPSSLSWMVPPPPLGPGLPTSPRPASFVAKHPPPPLPHQQQHPAAMSSDPMAVSSSFAGGTTAASNAAAAVTMRVRSSATNHPNTSSSLDILSGPQTTPIATTVSSTDGVTLLPAASPIVPTNSGSNSLHSGMPRSRLPALPHAAGRGGPSSSVVQMKPRTSQHTATAFGGDATTTIGNASQRPHSLSSRHASVDTTESSSTNNAKTSTLRKQRKTKLSSPADEPHKCILDMIPEFDAVTGKRLCTKKEHIQKVLEVLPFRSLHKGDRVAAKVSSRELWILASVLKDYPSNSPADLLKIHPSKRAQAFREPVVVMDVEDNGGTAHVSPTYSVARHAVLPLPRNYVDAAEWCQFFYRKGSRVFAMYPDTTALYSATVMDSTTYCQENDDIVVVQFDEDEPDETGAIQKCHIPSRFVTPMPNYTVGSFLSSSSRANHHGLASSGMANHPSLKMNSSSSNNRSRSSMSSSSMNLGPKRNVGGTGGGGTRGRSKDRSNNFTQDSNMDCLDAAMNADLNDFDWLDFDLGFGN